MRSSVSRKEEGKRAIIYPVNCRCGATFEAHVRMRDDFSHMNAKAKCPDCGKPLSLPDELIEPLVRLAL